MPKNVQPQIRNTLIADKEKRLSDTHFEGFGIYRPVSETILPELGEFARASTDSIESMLLLQRRSIANITPRQDFGITLAPYMRMRKELARVFRAGFDIGTFAREMADTDLMGELDLEIKEITWTRMGRYKEARHLVLVFEEDENLAALKEQLDFVRTSLQRAGLNNLANNPDKIHATVASYGKTGDGLALSRKQAKAALSIAETIRVENMIDFLPIDPLVLGKGYRSNHPDAQQVFDSHVPEY